MLPITPSVHYDDGSDLIHQMFVDRATIFRDRLKWDVMVNDQGEERDQYDTPDARYIILRDAQQRHRASCRLLPITSPCMTVEAFPGLFARDMINEPSHAIEVTRFCIMGDQYELQDMSAKLFVEGAHWLNASPFNSFVAVFYAPMLRVYRKSGWPPKIINKQGHLYVGQWSGGDYDGWDIWP